MIRPAQLLHGAIPFAIALAIWFTPVPAGLTPQAWHLFAVFIAAIASVLVTSSYFSVITAQGGSQNVIFVASATSRSAGSTASA